MIHRTIYRHTPVRFNMTPMIDVVFLLIIFFLVSSHLARQEHRIPLSLPVTGAGNEPVDQPTRRLTVNIAGDGRILIRGRPVGPRQLRQRMTGEQKRLGQDLEVRIRADRTVAYEHVGSVLVAAAQSDIWNVTFAVIRPEDVAL